MVAQRLPHACWLFCLGTQLTGCFGAPSPLAPGVSGSVGLPYNGVLTDAVELPKAGPGFVRYRPYGSRNFGTPALIHAVERAAIEVQRAAPQGEALVIGDLSARHGGKVSGHASHRSGRDVDLLLYAASLDGISVRSPGFIHYGSDGLAQTAGFTFLQLDAQREWLLIRALLTDPEAEVLWIFASRDVEALVTDYAIHHGEPAELVARAIRVMHQPRDSANHDDHLHVRVACTPQERTSGCESGGPAWPWLRGTTAFDTVAILDEVARAEEELVQTESAPDLAIP